LGTENAASAAPAVGGVGTEHSMAMAHTTAGKTMSGSSSHGLIIAIVAAILALAALAVVLLRGGDPAEEEAKSADVAETKGDDAPEATSGQAVEKPDAEPSGATVEADPAARDDAREAAHAPTSSAPTLAVPPEVPAPRPAPVSVSPAPAPRPKPKVQPPPKTSDVYDER
jgi:outer membrane biosynthesis protein TonB